MQNTNKGNDSSYADPFFRSNNSCCGSGSETTGNRGSGADRRSGTNNSGYAGRMNWNTETAAGMGTNCSMDTKDLSILQDEMHSEALLYKKCHVYASYFSDPQLRSLASNAAEHHRRHFDALKGYLDSGK